MNKLFIFIAIRLRFFPVLATLLPIFLTSPSIAQSLDWINHPEAFSASNDDGAGLAIVRDALGNLYVTGYFEGTTDFDPGAGTANLSSMGSRDIFLAKYNVLGNYVWAKRIGGTGIDQSSDMALDGSGNLCLTGSFSGTVDFDPNAGTANLTSIGGEDMFIAKYDASGNYLWAKRIGGNAFEQSNALTLDGSGNLHLTGQFEGTNVDFDPGAGTANLTSVGFQDIFIAKYDALGNYLWAKRIGGAGDDGGTDLAIDGSGNVHITGFFNNTVDFDPGAGTANLTSAGISDIFLAKYNASGSYIWAKSMGGTSLDFAHALALDDNGRACITGYFFETADFDPGAGMANLTSAGERDIFFAQYDASGNYLWANRVGGVENEESKDIVLDASGNVHITGFFFSTADFDPGAGTANLNSAGSRDMFIAKYSPSGGYLWAKHIGHTQSETSNALVLDGSGNVHATGFFRGIKVDFDPGPGTDELSASGGSDPFILSLSPAGDYNWAINYGMSVATPGNMTCRAIARDASGSVYATGFFSGTQVDFDPGPGMANLTSTGVTTETDIFLAKYDAAGNYLWAKRIGSANDDDAYGLAVDGNGNVSITGYFMGTVDFDPGAGTSNLTSAGDWDIFIAQYDASGNYLWAKQIGGTSNETSKSIAIDANNNLYITGYFRNTVDFDPGPGVANQTTMNYDIFIAKYDASGNYLWAKTLIGPGSYGEGANLVWDVSGHVYITGDFTNTIDFDPGPGTANLSSMGQSFDIFIAKYDVFGNYVWAKRMGGILGDEGTCLALDGVGNIYATGAFSGTADFDPGAGVANLTGQGGSDIFIAKYDPAGNYIWAKGIGGTLFDSGTSLALDGNNKISITGHFFNTADFDPGAGTANLTSSGETDVFLAQYDVAGNYLWAKNFGDTGIDYAPCIASGTGKINVGGGFNGTVDFDPGPGTANRTAISQFGDIFIAQYTDDAPMPNGPVPIITCPANIVRNNDPGQCSAIVQYNTPTSDDPLDNVAIMPPSLPSGSIFPVGTTAITWEATDGDGLTARCTFFVTVTDTQAPSIICPPNQTKGNDLGICSTTVSYPTPTASDNCSLPNGQPVWVSGGSIPQPNGQNSVSIFPKGTTTVTWKVTDAVGLTKTCTFRIIVNDTEAPVITCPNDIAANTAPNACASAPVVYGPVTATDNCMPPNPVVVRIGGLPSGSNFPSGINVVTWRATDGSGKTSTCSFKVTVTDGQAPSISCPNNLTATAPPNACSTTVFYETPSASDNCGVQATYLESGLASGSMFPYGTSPITWKTIDINGLTKTCTFSITVECGNGMAANGTQERTSEGQSDATANLLIAPNPATSQVLVSLKRERATEWEEGIELAVYDLSGRLVWQQELHAQQPQTHLTVETWPSGVYWVRVKGKGLLLAKRLVVL